MQITTDEAGYIENYATLGGVDGGTEVPDFNDEELAHFQAHYKAYKLVGDALVFDTAQDTAVTDNANKARLRIQREAECFAVINRGGLWYDTLTAEQVSALDIWYHAWLDVPETGGIPDKPDFI